MKILVSPYTHTLSHTSRPLLIAKELGNRGHEVIFAGESPKIKFIQNEGFKVLPLYEPDPAMLYGNIRKGRLRFIDNSTIERMVKTDIIIYKEVNPDLVLTDGRFTAPISTHILGLKHAAVVNVSSTEYRALPYVPFFDWIPERLIRRETGLWKMLDLINLKLEMFVFDNFMDIFKKLSKKYGLRKTVTATNCLTGKDITLLADIPEYFPTRNLPKHYHYIGPLTWKSNIQPPAWWPPKKDKKGLVYITMGSTGIGDFFHRVYELLKKSDMPAIVTTGAQGEDVKTIEGKIYVEPFMDGDLVMEKCDLVVCHGGNGTIYQALQHGKPIIGIPTIPDQKFNMRRIEALGAGKTISWNEFTANPQSLIELIMSITMDKSFYQNASRLKEILGTYNAPKIAADIIEKGHASL